MTAKRIWIAVLVTGFVSAAAAGAQSDAAREAAVAKARERYEHLLESGGQYMASHFGCSAPQGDIPGYEDLPVVYCDYESLGVSARVALLDPSATQLANWTVSACLDVGASDLDACVETVTAQIWDASNAQFPVNGFVVEPSQALGGRAPAGTPYCVLFREGVAVSTASFKTHSVAPGDTCGPDSANSESVLRALKFARIASTSRAMYAAAGGTEDVDAGGSDPFAPQWSAVIGKAYKDAWTSDRNFLIYAWARDAKARGLIQ